ncbi:hypothetical protein D030_2119A, partial [Vibrio parahaemolyticus AQ3810]|jgi:hypothetical protein
MTR